MDELSSRWYFCLKKGNDVICAQLKCYCCSLVVKEKPQNGEKLSKITFFILLPSNFSHFISQPLPPAPVSLFSPSSHCLLDCLLSHSCLLSSSLLTLFPSLIFHNSLSALPCEQSPSLLFSCFTAPSLPWCRALSAAAASPVVWNTADLSVQEPEIRVWCKRHLNTQIFSLLTAGTSIASRDFLGHFSCHQRCQFNYSVFPFLIYGFRVP